MTADEALKLKLLIRTFAANESQAAEAYAIDQDVQASRYGAKADAKWKEIEALIALHTEPG